MKKLCMLKTLYEFPQVVDGKKKIYKYQGVNNTFIPISVETELYLITFSLSFQRQAQLLEFKTSLHLN